MPPHGVHPIRQQKAAKAALVPSPVQVNFGPAPKPHPVRVQKPVSQRGGRALPVSNPIQPTISAPAPAAPKLSLRQRQARDLISHPLQPHTRGERLHALGFQGATAYDRAVANEKTQRYWAYQRAYGHVPSVTAATPTEIKYGQEHNVAPNDHTYWTPRQRYQAELMKLHNQGLPYTILNSMLHGIVPSSLSAIKHGHVPSAAAFGSDALFFLPWSRAAKAVGEGALAAKAAEDAMRVERGVQAAKVSFKSGEGLGRVVFRGGKRLLLPSERALARSVSRSKMVTGIHDILPRPQAQAQVKIFDDAARGMVASGHAKNLEDAYSKLDFKFHQAHNAPGDIKGLYQHVPPEDIPAMPAKLGVKGLSPKIYRMIQKGAPFRDWYARASTVLTEAASRLGVSPEQMAAITAITSQQANPTFNLRKALEAINEFKNTGAIDASKYLPGQADKITHVLQNPGTFDWGGLKTNSYFGNFLMHMNPELHDQLFQHVPVTVDRHMAEMFLGKQRITDKQYEQVRQIMIKTGEKLGWHPSEVQAAAWVTFKAGKLQTQTEVKALGKELMQRGEVPEHLMPHPEDTKKEAMKRLKLRAKWTREVYDRGVRAQDFSSNPLEHYMPSAGDAYERGAKMYKGELYQRLHREHTFASGVAQVHSEANPDMALHPVLRQAYDQLPAGEKKMYDRLVNKAVDGQFEQIIGLDHIGSHEGKGIWRGAESEGIASHLEIGTGPVSAEQKTKIEALAAAQGIVKHQDSVAWGRPMAAGHGEYKAIHWNPGNQDAAKLSAEMDLVAGAGNVGFIHAPDGGFYVVDFAGKNEKLFARLGGHQQEIGWDGHYATGKPGGDGYGTPYAEAIAKLPKDVQGKLLAKINQVKSQVDQLDAHFLHVPIAHITDTAGAHALAEQGGHVFHGTTPMHAEEIMHERRLRVGGSDPEAAWVTENPNTADFYARSGHRMSGPGPAMGEAGAGNVVAIPKHSIPGYKRGPLGNYGHPEDILFHQGEFGHLSLDQLHAKLDEINGRYNNVVDQMAKEHRPGDYKRVTAFQNARAKKMARRGLKYPTVTEQARAHAEDQLQKFIDANPEHPHVQALQQEQDLANRIRQEIYRRNDALLQSDLPHLPHVPQEEMGRVKGVFERKDIASAVIHLTKQADVTTLPHELGHFIRHFGLSGEDEKIIAEWVGAETHTVNGVSQFSFSRDAEEKFADGLVSLIRSGQAPKNLVAEFKALERPFREAYPHAGSLPKVPEHVAAVYKRLLNQKDGVPATLYYLLRNKIVAHSLISGPGHPRTDQQAEQHLNDLAAQLKRQGFGRMESEVPKLKPGEITAETGGIKGQMVRHALEGKVNTEGMGTYEAAGAKMDLGTSAASARSTREEGYSIERNKRLGRAVSARDSATSGIERYIAMSKELGGQLPSDAWRNMQGDVADHVDSILNFILDHEGVGVYDQKRAADAIMRGVELGRAPNKSEEHALRMIFGRETSDSFKQLIKDGKFAHALLEVASIPRAIMASYDFGAGLRQGIMFGVSRPGLFKKVYGEQFKYLKTANYEALRKAIESHPYYPIHEKMGIQYTDAGAQSMSQREEYFASHLAEQLIPGIKASDRLYTGFLNLARFTYANFMLEQGAKVGYDMADEHLLKSIGEYINAATGRGPLKRLQKAAPVLNALLFSPRLLASRIAFLNPFFYLQLHPFARREALRSARNFVTLIGGMGLIAHQAGARVSLDPTNADFMKIRVGNTRVDPTAGFTQEVRLMAQLIEGHVTSSITGRQENLSGKAFGVSRMDILQRWLRTKTNPVAGIVWDMLQGTDTQGKPVTFKNELANDFVPLVIQDFWQTFSQHHNIGAGALAFGLSETGVGVQTYGTPKKTAAEAVNKLISDSKAAGLPTPPSEVQKDARWSNELDNAVYAGESPYAKLKTAAKILYDKTGTDYSHLLGEVKTEGQAEQVYLKLRAAIEGSYTHWKSAIDKMNQAQKDKQPVPQSAPAPQHTSAAAPAPAMQETAYHVPIPDTGGPSRQLAAHANAPSGAAEYIAHAASQRGVDPQAVLAVASREGLSGGVGDSGTSFGPFQLHEGGALPADVAAKGPAYAQSWAWSPAGINYALDRIASVAKGLSGQAAVSAIVNRFERPANPRAEVAGAMSAYGQPVGGRGLSRGDRIPGSPGGSGGGGFDPLQASAMEGLQALATGHYDPSTQLLHLFRSMASTPLQSSIGGINFVIPGAVGKTARGVIALAQEFAQRRVPYVYGGESPSGFDCSGLMQYIWAKQGIQIPRTSQQQFHAGIPVARDALRPGDEVFFVGSDGTRSEPGHVGIYIGNGKFIEAPHTGATVRVSRLQGYPGYVGARRFAGVKT